MDKHDYHNYDSLKLFVKKEKAKDIIDKYQLLKWQLVTQNENDRYEDIVDLEFTRPHKIANKDKLQLLQVYLEEELNSFAKVESKKHSKSTIAGLIVGLFGLALMTLGVLINFGYSTVTSFVFSLIFFIIGSAFIGAEIFFLPKMVRTEKLTFLENKTKHEQNLQKICDCITQQEAQDE